jgi:crotonobetainyl-CoA:carnitine CoA-transferase CaiB-like acyl-CoA transferase
VLPSSQKHRNGILVKRSDNMLSGIRVIDLTRYLPGPHATLRLADMGAEVIKIEEPKGEPARQMVLVESAGEKKSSLYLSQNRGKRSVTADLKNPEDLKAVLELVKTADVFIESFRPGVTKRLGLDFDSLIKLNPNIVYCSMTGYGQESPLAKLGGHDINYLALSGIASRLTDSAGRPIYTDYPFADMIAGLALSEAVLAGIIYRDRNKKGIYTDFSMTDSVISLMGLYVMHKSLSGKDKDDVPVVSYYLYETKDGRFVTLGAIEQKFWNNFCTALKKENWIPEQYSAAEESNPVYKEISKKFKKKTLAEWEIFSSEVDCCMMPVYTPAEMIDHKYVRQRRMIEERWGQLHVATMHSASGSVLDSSCPPPSLGENNELLYKK